MAMHRRVTLPNLSGTVPFVHGRAHNSLEQDRQDFERNQVNAVLKSLSLDESAPKEKHVRTLIMGTFIYHGSTIFWRNVKDYASLYGNEVVCWKFLVILYRILQDGQASAIKDSIEEASFIEQVSKYHRNSRSELASYGRLSAAFGKHLLNKLAFHQKYPEIPANFVLKDSTLSSYDAGKNFELCVDFFDLLEGIIQMKKLVLDTFTPTKASSMTASGQCRLAPVIPWTYDSSRIVEILGKMLRQLHRSLPWDTLDGHRQRFVSLYNELKKIYDKLSNIQYLRGILQVPTLSGDINSFISSLHRMREEVEFDKDSDAGRNFDEEDSRADDLITVNESTSADAYSLAYIQAEYSDLSAKYQAVLQMLQDEKLKREAVEREFRGRVEQHHAEIENLKTHHELAVAAAAASASAASTAADESAKLEKLKTVYQKLRQDHITLLRHKGDLEKEKRESHAAANAAQQRCQLLENSIKEFLDKAQIQQGNDLNTTLQGAAQKMGQLLQILDEKEDQLTRMRAAKESENASKEHELEEIARKIPELENEVSERDTTIASISLELEKLKEQNEFLQQDFQKQASNLGNLNNAWRQQLRKMIVKLVTFLSAFPATSTPTINSVFGEDDATKIAASVVRSHTCDDGIALAATNDVIFYTMLAILKLQPYANPDTFDMKASMEAARTLVMLLNQEAAGPEFDPAWNSFLSEASQKMDLIKGIKWDPTNEVDKEIHDMQATIEEAAAALEKLMMEAKLNEQSKPNIDVDIKILDSCSQLFAAIQEVIRSGRRLQNEITADSVAAGTASRPEFYRKNLKWSEGLISASKDIGRGAKLLVDSANAVVNEQGKFEELIAASQEIAGSSAQMVVASKVKAKKDSQNMAALSSASKKVAEATAQVIAISRSSFASSEVEKIDFDKLSFHQSKRLEMEIQIKVLELETNLQKEREKLFSLRKRQYAANGNDADNQE